MISVQCPSCFYEMRVKDALLGKKVRCKACNEPVTVGVVEPPDDAEDELVFDKPASSRPQRSDTARSKKRRSDGPGQLALAFAMRYSGYIALTILVVVAFVAICSSRQFARAGMVLFGGGGLVLCGGAYAWALSQAAGEEPLALLGFVLPRYGLRMIFRHRERVHGPLPLFLIGTMAMGMGIISLRMSVPSAGGDQPKASPRQPVATAPARPAPVIPAAPRMPVSFPPIGGPTPVPTEAVESLADVKRGMKVWAFSGKWEQGTIVGRDFAGCLVVQMSEGTFQGRDLSQILSIVRIEASELKRGDLSGVPPVSEESPIIPGRPRDLQDSRE